MSVVNEPIGNAAAMREALEACVSDYETSGIDETTEKWHEEHFGEEDQSLVAWRNAKAALSEPPRNCDVGTAKEQTGRFLKFCDIHDCESDCPLFKANSCELAWAQMPYEAEEGGAK